MATSGRKIDEGTRRRIVRMARDGVSWRTIRRECDVAFDTISKYAHVRYQNGEEIDRQTGLTIMRLELGDVEELP